LPATEFPFTKTQVTLKAVSLTESCLAQMPKGFALTSKSL
jgi:hypothetical protein